MAPRRDGLRPPPGRGVGVALHDRQRLPRHARHLRRRPAGGAPRHLCQRLPRNLAHRLRRRGVRLREAGPDHRRRAGRQDHPAVRRRRAVLPADGDPRPLRAGARHARGDAGPHPRLGPFVRPARLHPIAPARLPRAPAPRGDLLRGDPAGLRRPRRHRLRNRGGGARDRRQRRSPHQAVRVRGARAPGEPRRRPPHRARAPYPVGRHDPVVRGRPRTADRLRLHDRRAVGRTGRADRLLDRRPSGRAHPPCQVRHLPLVPAPADRRALREGRAAVEPGRPARLRGPARQPAPVPHRLLAPQRRRGEGTAGVAADHTLQPLPHLPSDGAGRGRRGAGQGTDRPRLRGPLFLGHRDLPAAVPDLHDAANRAEPAASAPPAPGRRPAARRRAEPARRALSVAHHRRQRGVRLLRGGNRAVPHQRGHRVRPPQVRRRDRRHPFPSPRSAPRFSSRPPGSGSTSASSTATTTCSASTA